MLLYLIRHGKSLANSLGIQNGTKEDVLCEEGIAQACKLADWLRLSEIEATHYITSDWERAQQTAKILWPHAHWKIDARVGETNAGEASTWLSKAFQATYPNFHQSTANHYPGGESHDELNARVVNWLVETANTYAENEKVVLVGHAGSITCALQYVTGIGMDRFPAFLVPQTTLSVAFISPESSARRSRLLALSLCPQEAMSKSYIYNGIDWP
jgi:broad specificity phosphatase PhoE